MLRGYRPALLGKDLVAGLAVTTLLVPQGMAYAELAGLPVITGLYTTILALLGYALFGPSRILVLGPDSSLGPMIAATLVPLVAADGSSQTAVTYASALALMVGAITVLAGVFKLGFVADLLSKPTQIGYMNGLALTILVSQLPKLFGFSVDADGLIDESVAFAKAVQAGETVGAALAVGVACLALILVLQRLWPTFPSILAAVVLAIVAVAVFNLEDHDVALVGALPSGSPVHHSHRATRRPGPALRRRPRHLPGLPHRHHLHRVRVRGQDRSRDRREPRDGRRRSGQPRRWALPGLPCQHQRIADRRGLPERRPDSSHRARRSCCDPRHAARRTRLTPQPSTAGLARVVIAASLTLADIAGVRRLRRQRRSDFVLALVAFLSVALLGVLYGIAVAVGMSILNVFRRVWWPHQALLGRAGDLRGYHDTAYRQTKSEDGRVGEFGTP